MSNLGWKEYPGNEESKMKKKLQKRKSKQTLFYENDTAGLETFFINVDSTFQHFMWRGEEARGEREINNQIKRTELVYKMRPFFTSQTKEKSYTASH